MGTLEVLASTQQCFRHPIMNAGTSCLWKVLAVLFLASTPAASWRAVAAGHGFGHIGTYLKGIRATSRSIVQMKRNDGSALHMGASTMRRAIEIASTRFRQGDYWIWLYRDGSGQPSSWERYSVRASSLDAEVVIDMASRFSEDEEYNTHHRMRLSIGDCLTANTGPKQWCFREFAFNNDGLWCKAPHRDNVQAFEEKFNIYLMGPLPLPAHVVQTRTRQIAALGMTTLVQSQRHKYTGAWYVREPREHAGVAAFKAFGHENASDTYTFELVERGNDLIKYSGSRSLDTDGNSAFSS